MTSTAVMTHELHLLEKPSGSPRPEQFAVVSRLLPPIRHGEFLVRNRFLSIDPALRPPLSNGITKLNQAISGLAVGEILESSHPSFCKGDMILHRQGLRDYAVGDGTQTERLDIHDEPLHWHLGPLGFTGFTAYIGLFDVAELKPGETIFISAAAGAVGGVAAQMARLAGATVIGSVGSAAKVAWLRDVAGIERAINYKEVELRRALKAAAPDGLDIYFDNVGGNHLNAALPRMRLHGRVAICGMVSAYNNDGALSEGVTTLATMMYNRITMRAFIWQDHLRIRPQFLTAMRGWLKTGAIRVEDTIYHGLERVPEALIDLLGGRTMGKAVVEIT